MKNCRRQPPYIHENCWHKAQMQANVSTKQEDDRIRIQLLTESHLLSVRQTFAVLKNS